MTTFMTPALTILETLLVGTAALGPWLAVLAMVILVLVAFGKL